MINQIHKSNNPKYDLIFRTSKLGAEVINFVSNLKYSAVNDVLIRQIVRSSTSIGANYMEADCSESKKDFCYKIALCKKESKETVHWFNMITVANPIHGNQLEILRQEAHELTLIFSKIILNSKEKNSF